MAKKKAAGKQGPAEPETPVEEIRRRIRGTCDALKQANYLQVGEEEEYNRLIRDGVYFFGHHPLKEVPALKAKFGRRRWKQKMCFANAQEIVLDEDSAVYHEGVVESGVTGAWIHHAWVVVDGKVIDPTLAAGKGESGVLYYGLPFTKKEVVKSIVESDIHGPLLRLRII